MTIPDYISPMVGYRVWQWDSTGLKSLNGINWQPGKAFVAECRNQGCHDAPQACCTCGVYAAKGFDHLERAGYAQYGILGEVYLWGTVVEHEQGWRAQFGYPKRFVVPSEMLPFGMSRSESWLTGLAAYGCDIFVGGKQNDVPLWFSQTGYQAEGVDLLAQRSKDWYARRREERRIKPGDRVAVLGHGIAVVEQADHNQVHALLWNMVRVRIDCTDIRWDEQNMRWEAAVVTAMSKRASKETNAHALL
jgi:hypothetical protein